LCLVVLVMIRTLLLAALVAMAMTAEVVDQAEWYGPRMGSGPFCDSRCLPNEVWKFRRDWKDLESAVKEKYIFFGDGPASWWDRGCGDLINDFFITQTNIARASAPAPNVNTYLNCEPERLYFMELNFNYQHEDGRLTTEFYIKDSYKLAENSWAVFINDFVEDQNDSDDVDDDSDTRTNPWTLIRSFPSLEGATKYHEYDKKVSLKMTFIANYERNFCTFVGSVNPILEVDLCDYTDDDDDTDDIKYITRDFCHYILGDLESHDIRLDCGVTDDNDNCDGMQIYPNGCDAETDDCDVFNSLSRSAPKVPMKRLREMVLGARLGGTVREATEEQKREMIRARMMRGARDATQYQYENQPIPGFGTVETSPGVFDPAFWSTPWSQSTFYFVPYTSSITAPYCAYRDD